MQEDFGQKILNSNPKEDRISKYLESEKSLKIINEAVTFLNDKSFSKEEIYANLHDKAIEIAKEIFDGEDDKEIDFTDILDLVRLGLTYEVDSKSGRFNRLKQKIEEKSPETLSPNWIQKNDISTYRHITKTYKDTRGETSWLFLTKKLGIDKFKFQGYSDWSNPDTLIKHAKALEKKVRLEKERDPDSFIFNTSTIRQRDSNLYDIAKVIFRDPQTGNIDWWKLVSLMSPDLQDDWREQAPKRLKQHLDLITKKIEELKPQRIYPRWILNNISKTTYNYVYRYYRRIGMEMGYGRVDWESFAHDLGPKWGKRFKAYPSVRLEEITPKDLYENEGEIKSLEDRFGDNYYLASILLDKEMEGEKEIQDEIFTDLIELARQGNLLAEKRIIKHLEGLIDDWETEGSQLAQRLQFMNKEEFHNDFRRCIYSFDQFRDRYRFVDLIIGRLKFILLKQNQWVSGRSLDAPISGDDDRTLGDLIS